MKDGCRSQAPSSDADFNLPVEEVEPIDSEKALEILSLGGNVPEILRKRLKKEDGGGEEAKKRGKKWRYKRKHIPNSSERYQSLNKEEDMAQILILEDDAEIATLIKLILESEGYHPIYSNNDQDAMSLLRNRVFHLLIMSIIEGEGWGFYNLVKTDPLLRGLRVIVLSRKNALIEENTEWSSIVSTNRDVILVKPPQKEELIETVKYMLDGPDTVGAVGVI